MDTATVTTQQLRCSPQGLLQMNSQGCKKKKRENKIVFELICDVRAFVTSLSVHQITLTHNRSHENEGLVG